MGYNAPMKILFLHGWQSTPGGLKPTYLRDHGHEVLNPALPDDDFDAAVRIAQADDVVPFSDSEELVRNSSLPSKSLIEVGFEHRLADEESLAAMVRAIETATSGFRKSGV